MVLDEALRGRIAEILERLRTRWPDLDPRRSAHGNRKQATFPRARRSSSRSGRRPGWSCRRADGRSRPDRRRAARARRASCSRCGRRPRETDAFRAAIGRARRSTARRCCGCSASRSPRSPRRCASPSGRASTLDALEVTTCLRARRDRDRHALRARRAGGLRRVRARSCASATPRHAVLRRRLVGRRAGRRAAARRAGAHGRHGGVVHRRPAGGAADRAARVLGVRSAAGIVVYSNEAKADAGRASTRR